jgi:putative membrane protein
VLHDLYERVPVRDGLAAERTILAAERTFLAYLRTAFAMFVTGITGSAFLERRSLIVIAYILTGLSAAVFLLGIVRFIRSYNTAHRMLLRLEREPTETV